MSNPKLYLETGFLFDEENRILSTREPGGGTRGPLFTLVRGPGACAWAVRVDVPDAIAKEIGELARDEPPGVDFAEPPAHAARYIALLQSGNSLSQSGGPTFVFPDEVAEPDGVTFVEDERQLGVHFSGWVEGEIAAGRSPVAAVVQGGAPVSVCFCARRSDDAAEAGVETAEASRRRGFARSATAAWALAVRRSGRVPLYSTSWSNRASLGLARKLELAPYASWWSVSD